MSALATRCSDLIGQIQTSKKIDLGKMLQICAVKMHIGVNGCIKKRQVKILTQISHAQCVKA